MIEAARIYPATPDNLDYYKKLGFAKELRETIFADIKQNGSNQQIDFILSQVNQALLNVEDDSVSLTDLRSQIDQIVNPLPDNVIQFSGRSKQPKKFTPVSEILQPPEVLPPPIERPQERWWNNLRNIIRSRRTTSTSGPGGSTTSKSTYTSSASPPVGPTEPPSPYMAWVARAAGISAVLLLLIYGASTGGFERFDKDTREFANSVAARLNLVDEKTKVGVNALANATVPPPPLKVEPPQVNINVQPPQVEPAKAQPPLNLTSPVVEPGLNQKLENSQIGGQKVGMRFTEYRDPDVFRQGLDKQDYDSDFSSLKGRSEAIWAMDWANIHDFRPNDPDERVRFASMVRFNDAWKTEPGMSEAQAIALHKEQVLRMRNAIKGETLHWMEDYRPFYNLSNAPDYPFIHVGNAQAGTVDYLIFRKNPQGIPNKIVEPANPKAVFETAKKNFA